MLEQINKFIEYWWFRYLMVTELYIVEKWERVTMRKYHFHKNDSLQIQNVNQVN